MDNQDTQQDNVEAQDTQAQDTQAQDTSIATFKWKENLGPDMANSPTIQKFGDDKEGLVNAVKSHLELEKMLGHEKIPLPKGPDDVEGHNRLNKALGVPDQATQYDLKDASLPEQMGGVAFDKNKFAEIVHAHKLTPRQAQGLWQAYTEQMTQAYHGHMKASQEALTSTINQLRGEWGDAYDSNVEVGQMVINKFASNDDMNKWLTETLAPHPFGAKFLAQIGKQFTENKIGDFKYQSFSLSPDDAEKEINQISNDPKHPYNNEKSSVQEREAAINYVNSLHEIVLKGKQGKA